MGDHQRLTQLGRLYTDLATTERAEPVIAVARELEKAGLGVRAYALLEEALNSRRIRGTSSRQRRYKRALMEAAGVNALKRGDVANGLKQFSALALAKNERASEWRRLGERIAKAGYPASAAKFLDHPLTQAHVDALFQYSHCQECTYK